MQIFVRSVGGNTLTLSVDSDVSANELKAKISDIEFIPSQLFSLSYGSVVLAGDLPAGLLEQDTVVVGLPVVGGMRAKWRKKRMRRLRRKRRKMRMRAK